MQSSRREKSTQFIVDEVCIGEGNRGIERRVYDGSFEATVTSGVDVEGEMRLAESSRGRAGIGTQRR